MSEYRGPYFRTGHTGKDGAVWEAETEPGKILKRIVRKPLKWELQTPISTVENHENQKNGHLEFIKDKNEKQEGNPSGLSKEKNDKIVAGPSGLNKEKVEKSGPSGINKVKSGLLSLHREKNSAIEPLYLHKKSTVEELETLVDGVLGDDKKRKHTPRNARIKIGNQNVLTEPSESNTRFKLIEEERKADLLNERVKNNLKKKESSFVGVPWANQEPDKKPLSAKEQKAKIFENFRLTSAEPPNTPPTNVSTASAQSDVSSLPNTSVEKKRGRKSPLKATAQKVFYILEPNSTELSYPPGSPYERDRKIKKPQLPKKSHVSNLKSANSDQGINSMLLVKKLSITNGYFDDSMISPDFKEPKKSKAGTQPMNKTRRSKRGVSEGGKMTPWILSHNAFLNNYILNTAKTEEISSPYGPNSHLIPAKTNQTRSGSAKNGLAKKLAPPPTPTKSAKIIQRKKPIHPSKEFPVHVPGPRRENIYIGPYSDDETESTGNDLKTHRKY